MDNNICHRNIGCSIRTHNHCNFNCRIKHSNCKETCYNFNYDILKTEVKRNLQLRKYSIFFDKIVKKYNISTVFYNNNDCFNMRKIFQIFYLVLDKKEINFIQETFLSNKEITPEISIKWISEYLFITSRHLDIVYCFIIILFYELFTSCRYNYILNNKNFKHTIIKKYQEYINYNHIFLSDYLKKHFFKNILELCLKNKL